MAERPAAGLELLDALAGEPALVDDHLLPAVRGDVLVRMRRSDEAEVELARAARLTGNEAERRLLLERARRAEAEATSYYRETEGGTT